MHAVGLSVSLLLHLALVAFMVREYRWEYGVRAWRQGWGWLIASVLVVIVRRLLLLFEPWLSSFDASTLDFAEDWLPLLLNSVCMFIGVWRLSTVFHVDLPPFTPPEGIILIDPQSVILAWNLGAEAIFGWTPAEAIGQTLMQTIILPQDWEAHRAGVARWLALPPDARTLVRSYPALARHKDTHRFEVQLTITAIALPGDTWQFQGTVRRLLVL